MTQSVSKESSASKTTLNAIIIYVQKFLSAAISFVTTPIILNALGVEDYGLYTLVVGFVAMLAILNWSLSSSSQRYIAFALGQSNKEALSGVFSSTFYIHLGYGFLLILLIPITGFFSIDSFLNIPVDRVEDSKIILLFVTLITFCSIVSIPFVGVLKAHENFFVIAVIGIVESILKILIALLIVYTSSDKLLLYSALLVFVSVITLILFVIITKFNYEEVVFRYNNFDKTLSKEMLSFFGWNLLGAMALLSRNQGVSILINIFFGVIKNAAYGIAMQINAALGILSQGIIGSISPQIVKSAGAADFNKMFFLMKTMSKFAFFSVSIVAIPLFFEAPFLLKIWLEVVPEETIIYVRLIVMFSLLMLISSGIQTVFHAIGKVRLYNIWVSSLLLLNLPISYLLFQYGFLSYSIIIVGMVLEFVALFVRLLLLTKYVDFSILEFLKDQILRVLIPVLCLSVVIYYIKMFIADDKINLIVSCFLAIIIYPVFFFLISIDKKQKELAISIFNKLAHKIRK